MDHDRERFLEELKRRSMLKARSSTPANKLAEPVEKRRYLDLSSIDGDSNCEEKKRGEKLVSWKGNSNTETVDVANPEHSSQNVVQLSELLSAVKNLSSSKPSTQSRAKEAKKYNGSTSFAEWKRIYDLYDDPSYPEKERLRLLATCFTEAASEWFSAQLVLFPKRSVDEWLKAAEKRFEENCRTRISRIADKRFKFGIDDPERFVQNIRDEVVAITCCHHKNDVMKILRYTMADHPYLERFSSPFPTTVETLIGALLGFENLPLPEAKLVAKKEKPVHAAEVDFEELRAEVAQLSNSVRGGYFTRRPFRGRFRGRGRGRGRGYYPNTNPGSIYQHYEGKCWACGGSDHFARECPNTQGQASANETPIASQSNDQGNELSSGGQ